MEIVCPDCGARYHVPDERIVPGARVRCAHCARTWVPSPTHPQPGAIQTDIVAEQPAAPRSEPPPAVPERLASTAAPPARDRLAAFAWIATLVVLVAVALAAWQYRPQIEHAWPPSQRVYDLF